jgi:hypothetical protein
MELFSFEGIVADIIAKSRQTGENQTNLLSLLELKQVGEFLKVDDDDNNKG